MSAAPLPDDSLVAGLTPRERKKPATLGLLLQTTDAVLGLIAKLRVGERRVGERLSDAERRLAALEAASLPTYEGVYEPGKAYRQGSLVTRSGSLWLALSDTSDTPGAGATGWRLIVKSGAA